jgi:hypothetical protein
VTTVALTLAELAAVVAVAVALATTDAAAVSRLGLAWVSKRAGVAPREITRYDRATDGDDDAEHVEAGGDRRADP